MTKLLEEAIAALSQLPAADQDVIARRILEELTLKKPTVAALAPSKIERIYTDGACSGNPGPGGWGTVIYFTDGSIHEMGGADPKTTNNRMEMQAAIEALKYLQKTGQTEPIELYTDSEYVKTALPSGLRAGRKKAGKRQRENQSSTRSYGKNWMRSIRLRCNGVMCEGMQVMWEMSDAT